MSDTLKIIIMELWVLIVYIFAYSQGKREALRKLNSQVGVSREENL